MAAAPGSGGGLQVNLQELQQAGQDLAQLAAAVRDLAAAPPAACSAAASSCPGWAISTASSDAGARWHRLMTTQAEAVAGAGDRLTAAAAKYQLAEAGLVQKISAIGKPAGR